MQPETPHQSAERHQHSETAMQEVKSMLQAICLVIGIDAEDHTSILKARATFQFIEDMHANRMALVAKASAATIGLIATGVIAIIFKHLGLGSIVSEQ